MKIALVVPGGVDRSGVRRVIPCLLWFMERIARRHDLHVFSLLQDPHPCRYELRGATVHNMGAHPRRLRAVASLVREHRRGAFDVLHAIWAVHPGVVAALAGQLLRRPVLLHVTGGDLTALPELDYGALRSPRGQLWLHLAAGGATRISTPSAAMGRVLDRRGLDAELLPFGVALDRWPPASPRRRAPDRPARILWVGTLNQVKDPGMLLRTAVHLRQRGVDFELDLVGEDLLDGRIQREAGALGLDDRVRFHGFVPHPDLRRHVIRADLLLVTSRHEADPVVALEAAVAGVPVAGTRVGHLSDWAPEAAVTAPVGDAEGLAAEVALLLSHEERRLELAAAAAERARARDADWTARRALALYREMSGGDG